MSTDQVLIEKSYCERINCNHEIKIMSHSIYSADAALMDIVNTFECLCPTDCIECRTCENNW
jgi:hypothetical protein